MQKDLGVSKNSGFSPKMDGENFMVPTLFFTWDDLGGIPTTPIFGSTPKWQDEIKGATGTRTLL